MCEIVVLHPNRMAAGMRSETAGIGASRRDEEIPVLLIRDVAGLAHMIVRQRVPRHVARQVEKLMSDASISQVNR